MKISLLSSLIYMSGVKIYLKSSLNIINKMHKVHTM